MKFLLHLILTTSLALQLSQRSKPALIQSDTPFGPDSRIAVDEVLGVKRENGTLNGILYEFFYSDGSGIFAGTEGNSIRPLERSNWNVGCRKDPITDEKSCYMDKASLRVWVDNKRHSEIYIGVNHYPGSPIVIRIDGGKPLAINSRMFNGSFGFRSSPAIIAKLSKARTYTTRYQEWPYRDYNDDTQTTYGFNESLQYIKWAVDHIR